MKLTGSSFPNNGRSRRICILRTRPKTHVTLSKNRNPELSWSDAPAGTKSFALICHDSDVPSKGDDVNQEGRDNTCDMPRVDFYHWVLVDLPANATAIKAGEFSDGVTPRGKKGPAAAAGRARASTTTPAGLRRTSDMAGNYFGYDGPCPPWNDTIPHHYVFTLYALDLDKCPVSGTFKGPDVLNAIRGHVLAQATWTGIYSLNPSVKI